MRGLWFPVKAVMMRLTGPGGSPHVQPCCFSWQSTFSPSLSLPYCSQDAQVQIMTKEVQVSMVVASQEITCYDSGMIDFVGGRGWQNRVGINYINRSDPAVPISERRIDVDQPPQVVSTATTITTTITRDEQQASTASVPAQQQQETTAKPLGEFNLSSNIDGQGGSTKSRKLHVNVQIWIFRKILSWSWKISQVIPYSVDHLH